MLDEPASGLSRGERQLLTDLLLELDREHHARPHRARHGHRAPRRRAGDDDARRAGDRRRHAGRDPRRTSSSTTCTSGAAVRVTSMSEARARTRPCSQVEGLNAFYAGAHVLHDVTFEIGGESVAIIGRNGMGKTTLCAAIMGLVAPAHDGIGAARGPGAPGHGLRTGSRGPGIGYVPQGRRLFPSLTVDEHLQDLGGARRERRLDARSASTTSSRVSPSARRTAARSSPAASSRCSRSGARCSGTRSCSSWTSRPRVSPRRSSRR